MPAQKKKNKKSKSCEVISGQDWRQNSDVNGRQGMVLIRSLGKTMNDIFQWQGKIKLRVR